MKLIINADDFGLTKGISKAILELLNKKKIKSTTIMINHVDENDLIKLSKIKNISIGLHFVLDSGFACLQSSLTDENKLFISRNVSKDMKELNYYDVYNELESQFNKLSKYVDIDHIDSHHHAHLRLKSVNRAVRKFAETHNVFIRESKNESMNNVIPFGTRYYDNSFYKNGIYNILNKLKKYPTDSIIEIMAHPGYEDDQLKQISSYNFYREKEIKEIEKLSNSSIEIISYKEL